jgi:hypothetical protein
MPRAGVSSIVMRSFIMLVVGLLGCADRVKRHDPQPVAIREQAAPVVVTPDAMAPSPWSRRPAAAASSARGGRQTGRPRPIDDA